MRKLLLTATIAVVSCVSALAHAVVYDTGLAPPGTYYGSGNTNDHWVTNTLPGGGEIGMRTVLRFLGSVAPVSGTATYLVPLGFSTAPAAKWNWDFSVNGGSLPAGTSLSNLVASLTVHDWANNTIQTLSNLLLIPDNAVSGNTKQNSENLAWFAPLLASYFNPNQNDTYDFTMTVRTLQGVPLGSVGMTVVAGEGARVPEPASITLLGVGLLGLGFTARRRFA